MPSHNDLFDLVPNDAAFMFVPEMLAKSLTMLPVALTGTQLHVLLTDDIADFVTDFKNHVESRRNCSPTNFAL